MVSWHTVAIGFASGFISALGVDLHSYSQSSEGSPFNWKKAAARWISGGIGGAATAAGLTLTGMA